MFKYLLSCAIMQTNAAVITVACLVLCLTFNYTFPLHKVSTRWSPIAYHNHTQMCDGTRSHINIVERAKKMILNIEDAKSKLKNMTKDSRFQSHLAKTVKHSAGKNSLSEADFRQYEQLVIMKKYPYLDLKDLELKFSPSHGKNPRQSVKFNGGSDSAGDPGICEPLEDGPNVEIINRGLTGFAIPAKISKVSNVMENKLKLTNAKELDSGGLKSVKLTKPDVVGLFG